MIDNPLRLFVEQGTAGVDIDLMVVNESSVATFGIFSSSMEEKSRYNGFSNEGIVFSTGFY